MPVEMTQPSALELWIEQYGGIIYFFGQLIFWLALAAAAVYAVVLLKKLVDHKVGTGSPSDDAVAKTASPADGESIDIDKFVE